MQTAQIIRAVLPSLGGLAEFHCPHPPKIPPRLQRASVHGRGACLPLSSSSHTVSKGEGPAQAGYRHRTTFLAFCVFLILFQSRGKPLWGQCEPFTVGRMSKGSCALSRLWTQWWSTSIYMQYRCGTAASCSSAASDINEAGQSCFYRYKFSSSGLYTCIVLQRLWPNSFLPQGSSAELPHPSQSPNQNHISGQWAGLLAPGPAAMSGWGST